MKENNLPENNSPDTLRAWANAQMAFASAEFYSAEQFAQNCTASHRADSFWEVRSPDMGANRAGSGSTSFWVEWACYIAATRGLTMLRVALATQDETAAQAMALLPTIREATHRIAICTEDYNS